MSTDPTVLEMYRAARQYSRAKGTADEQARHEAYMAITRRAPLRLVETAARVTVWRLLGPGREIVRRRRAHRKATAS